MVILSGLGFVSAWLGQCVNVVSGHAVSVPLAKAVPRVASDAVPEQVQVNVS